MDWVQIRIPKELMDEIIEIIKKKPHWINEHEFIRDAVREKIDTISKEA